ncbi:hypothetical protein KDC22_23665 [Paenibacillus tritici]|uniref:hypothetical protein n=1 Tax=Paenibacillus tritici TaxID=1873425 RepID=UPI001BA4F253|nr:hypothetical protein [Paenibacillus tritici]QUL53376.1 hypothetical protein KDC22_23665 [Paenibacillus tritici]
MPQPESSIWGNILTCAEIGLHVYGMMAEHNSGIVVDADYAKEVLSEEALQAGESQGDHIYFDDAKSIIPAYELLKKDAITDPEFKEWCGSPEKLTQDGEFFAPEYFGGMTPPATTPWGDIMESQEFYNGISMVNHDGEWALAVHQTIAKHCLSEMAQEVAAGQENYLFYPLDACSIPVYELSASHPAMLEQIINEDSLVHTLCEDHPVYVTMHNLHVEEWGRIYDQPAPRSLFLQIQLDQEARFPATEQYDNFPQSHQDSISLRERPDNFFEPTEEPEW